MRVLFIGTGEIGVPVLRWLLQAKEHELVGVVTQPDRPAGRHQKIQPTPIKTALGISSVPVLQPDRIKHAEAVAQIGALKPEVVVVMAYGQILPRAVLDLPSMACLNLHASLLPKYRGAAPIQAAIAAGDEETGLTVIYMDEGLDTGDILLQSRIAIAPHETGGSLHDRLGELAPAVLAEALSLLQAGHAPRLPQKNEEASHAPRLEREDGRVDWSQAADIIERKIRAYQPWPGTYAVLSDPSGHEQHLKIFSADPRPDIQLSTGQLQVTPAAELLIGAGDGALCLQQVQLEGKKRMPAADLVRGHPWLAQAAVR